MQSVTSETHILIEEPQLIHNAKWKVYSLRQNDIIESVMSYLAYTMNETPAGHSTATHSLQCHEKENENEKENDEDDDYDDDDDIRDKR